MMAAAPFYLFAICAAASGLLAIGAHYTIPPRITLIYVFKPLTTVLVLVMALAATELSTFYKAAIAIGLAFSLAGDIFLMLPGNRFLQGLASFFAAHVCYSAAFAAATSQWVALWPFALTAAITLALTRVLWPGIARNMRLPVAAYVAIIAMMAALALHRWFAGPDARTSAAAAGAWLFFISDALLAVDRFRFPFKLARVGVLGTYWLGQFLIARSI